MAVRCADRPSTHGQRDFQRSQCGPSGQQKLQPMFHLQVVNGPHRGQEITVHNTSITLGRASHCHLVLSKDTGVSRTHGELVLSGSTVWYTDLLSHNGSRIRKRNGSLYTLSPLFSRCELEPGDLIFVGNTVIEMITAGDSSICFDGDVTLVPESAAVAEPGGHASEYR